jgi:hypothetical protein
MVIKNNKRTVGSIRKKKPILKVKSAAGAKKKIVKKRYHMGGTTGDDVESQHVREPQTEPRGIQEDVNFHHGYIRGDAPKSYDIPGRIRGVLEAKRAARDFAYKYNVIRDTNIPNRFWLDREHYIEVDLFDQISIERAVAEIYEFKRNPTIVRGSIPEIRNMHAKGGGRGALSDFIRSTNPEALKSLYGGKRKDLKTGRTIDNYEAILMGEDVDYIDSIDYTPRGGGKKKKRVPPEIVSRWFTEERKMKTKPKRNKTNKK